MRLTKKSAVFRTIELWEWLAETGKEKENWPGWEKYGGVLADCFLCEYNEQRDGPGCLYCPYRKVFGGCLQRDAPYDKWRLAETPEERKKYAKEFLEQMYEVRDGSINKK